MDNIIFLVDFDGTVTLSDLALHVMDKFADKKWEYYEKQYQEKKLTLEETIIAEYSLIMAPKNIILEEIEPLIKIRDNFYQFIDFLHKSNISINIVSGGIDFIIKHIIDKHGFKDTVKIISPKTEYQPDGSLKVTNPSKYYENSLDFKIDVVNHFKNKNYFVIYIGDGSSDFNAVMNSDLIFAVRNSSLAKHCAENDLNFKEFDSFKEIIQDFRNGEKKIIQDCQKN